MKTRSIARIGCAVLLLAVGLRADDRRGQRARPPRQDDSPQAEFILCARPDRVDAVARRHGLTVVRAIDAHAHGVVLVRGPVPRQRLDAVHGDQLDAFARQLLDEVRGDPDVVHFDSNGSSVITEIGASPELSASTVEILDSLSRTATSYFGRSVWTGYVGQPALGIIQLPEAQALADGRGLIVAVIDTGVDPDHPALAGSLIPGYDFTRDIDGFGSEWLDLEASTVEILDAPAPPPADPGVPVPINPSTLALVDQATASQIDLALLPPAFGHGTMVAGLVHVVAPAAKIMPLKAFDASGNSTIFDIERAIYYAVDHGAKVINMSFTSANAAAEITHAIDYAGAHGVISLASVGNAGRRDVVFPAGYRNVMAIASTSLADQRSTFTNYGDHLVQFAAPGETLVTLYPGGGYAAVSGTSFSTAMMSGAAALLSQLVPLLDQRLAGRYFDDGAIKQPGSELGNGRVNVYETLRLHEPGPPPSPPPAAIGFDRAGNQTTASVSVTVTNDSEAPNVTMAAPAAGAVLAGTVTLSAAASDDAAVVALQFTLDGTPLGEARAIAPYTLDWDSGSVANGAHVLGTIARNAAGHQQAVSLSVVVANMR